MILRKFSKITYVLCVVLFYVTTAYSHVDDANFQKAIKEKSFQVRVSNKNLANMHEASTILIDCVDFRLRDETERLMREHLKLVDNYDEITIPGASLAMETEEYANWRETTNQVITILKSIHNVKRVIFLDHRECGAYKLILGKERLDTKAKETAEHKRILKKAMADLKKTFPDLEVYALLIGLDGKVENFTE